MQMVLWTERGVGSLFLEEMLTRAWWIYVAAFLFGITLIVLGIVQANTTMVALGLVIGVVLFFARRYIQQQPPDGK